MKFNFIWNSGFVLVWAFVCSAQTPNYCNITTCPAGTIDTLCLYTSTTWGSACKPAFKCKSRVSTSDIATILQVNNQLRSRVANGLETRGNPGPQPSASDMRQLYWDNELAVMAQTHAQQCVFEHDGCRDVSRFQVGQNIYLAQSTAQITTSNWTKAILSWYSEVDNMQPSYVTTYPETTPKVIGHYTQLVWGETYAVGCGIAYYNSTALSATFSYNAMYVCNYGPTGNWIGEPMYTQGPAGTACPSGTANANGLCPLPVD